MALLTTTQRAIAQAANGAATPWTGTPRGGFYLRAADLPMLVLGLFFVLIGLFMLVGFSTAATTKAHDAAFPLVFLVFWMSVALSQTILPVMFAAAARSQTYYALTSDAYAIIVTTFLGTRVKRVFLPALSNVELNLRADGSGTIAFGTPPSGWFAYRGWGSPAQPPAFERVNDAARVYELCSQLQRSAANKPS